MSVFAPEPPSANLTDIEGYSYPPANPEVESSIMMSEIIQAIRRTTPKKAPEADEITNLVLKEASHNQLFMEVLYCLYNASLQLQYCPEHFKESITVILPKLGKGDYTEPKFYRSIALLNTLGKIIESIIATRTSYLVESTLRIMPDSHLGGRKLRSTENTVYLLLERIASSFECKNDVVTALSMDIKGAFDNISRPRLRHNIRKRLGTGIIADWLDSWMEDRTTTLRLSDFTKEYQQRTGIPQGSSLSPILYIIYNADLIRICQSKRWGISSFSWIDDATVVVAEDTAESNCRVLRRTIDLADD